MPNKLIVGGSVTLREDYVNEKKSEYYAVFKGHLEVEGFPNVPNSEIPIPITRKQYLELKRQLATSDAESPVLRVKGGLDIIVSGHCIN